MSKFNEMLKASFKSQDTEEWLDVHFTRPIGLVLALLFKRLGIHPNTVTIISIFLGAGSGWMFSYTDLRHNLLGIALLMSANFLDSADGQLARLTDRKTLLGRVLDGFSGDVWFFAIYAGLCFRMMYQFIPGTDIQWGLWIWLLAFVASIICHSPQSSLADYYRQIHLFFLKGKEGSELDNYASQRKIYDNLPKKGAWFAHLFYFNYANYCKSQEKRSPAFQSMMHALKNKYRDVSGIPETLRIEFLDGSRPLMKYTNILTFNTRAICIYATCLLGCPWVYMLIEITLLNILYIYMRKKHENLCSTITRKIR